MPRQKGKTAKGYYKRPESPFYQYDFQIAGVRFSGSTGATTERAAKAEVRRLKALKAAERRSANIDAGITMTAAAARYYLEKAQYLKDAKDAEADLARLVEFFGPATRLVDAANGTAAKKLSELVARRRADTVANTGRLISNATVNRSVIDCFSRLINFAREAWNLKSDMPRPEFRALRLPEAGERCRELTKEQYQAVRAAIRQDYLPLFEFAAITGVRLSAALSLTWGQVDLDRRVFRILVKDKNAVERWHEVPLVQRAVAVLAGLRGDHETRVFTYVIQRGRDKGKRAPITKPGLRRVWDAARNAARLDDFKWHDLRHHFATQLLRHASKSNLKTVQRALGHKTLEATNRYAHVAHDDVADAMKEAFDRPGDAPGQDTEGGERRALSRKDPASTMSISVNLKTFNA